MFYLFSAAHKNVNIAPTTISTYMKSCSLQLTIKGFNVRPFFQLYEMLLVLLCSVVKCVTVKATQVLEPMNK